MNARELLSASGPRPWWIEGNTAAIEIVNARDESVAMMDLGVSPFDRGAVDAELIVAAVNDYEAHVALADAARRHIDHLGVDDEAAMDDWNAMVDALARLDALRTDLSPENTKAAGTPAKSAPTASTEGA